MAKKFFLEPLPDVAREMRRIANLKRSFKSGLSTALSESSDYVTEEAKRLILDPPKTGRIYTRRVRGRRVKHQASAPGQPPANMTGKLMNSIKALSKGHSSMTVGVEALYGGFLEEGTPKMEPRPYLAPTEESTRKKFRHGLTDRVRSEVHRRR